MRGILLLLIFPLQLLAQPFSAQEVRNWKKQAARVTIIRDNRGIPHIYGKSDADAVFGLLYAQCEDDFNRVESNYIEKLGRMAEVKGPGELYNDLLNRLVLDSAGALRDYQRAPHWLKQLCNAFADGINFYLYSHPQVKPALLTRFQPWYPLLWTDGSIGAISTADITLSELKDFYSGPGAIATDAIAPDAVARNLPWEEPLPTGSNGFAFSPSITESGKAILYINPHTSFYFRPEVHMVSEQGLNAYGAVTWGQFFIYQGFNQHCGWMHTSSYVDAADSYQEKIEPDGEGYTYTYEGRQLPVQQKPVTLHFKNNDQRQSITVNTLHTHHGPVMARRNGQYLSLRADNRLLEGLIQCWQRTRARGLQEFRRTLDLKGNISNNTVYADAKGNIAYWHGNRVPKRDTSYNWAKPVDGSIRATEWKGYHAITETLHLLNPPNGWLQNCNSSPFRVAGEDSPPRHAYPSYMAPDGENFRGLHAVRVLSEQKGYTLDKVIAAGYDTRLAAFERMVPALVSAFEQSVSPRDSLYAWLAGPVAVLKHWDYRSSESSVATTLAVEWAQRLLPSILRVAGTGSREPDQVEKTTIFMETATPPALLLPLLQTIRDLQARYGRWQLPWGEVNRFQRISPSIDMQFDDARPSSPVGFVAGTWGMLPSYNSRVFPGTAKRYGIHGNSFICVVEFGEKVRAKALLAGGQSGDPSSPHFNDQVEAYSKGQFRDVLFYEEDVLQHKEKEYHPGQPTRQ